MIYYKYQQKILFVCLQNVSNQMIEQQQRIKDVLEKQKNILKEQIYKQSTQSIEIQLLKSKYPGLLTTLKIKCEQIKCKQGNKFILICCNPKCKHNSFMCGVNNCSCQEQHQNCYYKISQTNIFKSFEKRLNEQDKLIIQIQEHFQKMIDTLSEFRDNLVEGIKYWCFSSKEIFLLKYLLKDQHQNLQGTKFHPYFQYMSNNLLEISQQELNQQIKRQLNQLSTKLNQSIELFNNVFNARILKQKKSNDLDTILVNSQSKILDQSSLLTLKSFLPNKSFQRLRLLYYKKGLTDRFSNQKFYQKCSNISNTVILIKTTKQKIIGGFTPMAWKKYEKDRQISDLSKQSFIFSLTNKDKFTLTDQRYAISYVDGSGPIFGKQGHPDLSLMTLIQKKNSFGNKLTNGYVLESLCYVNPKYKPDSQSYQKFTGFQHNSFIVEQWEVFEVIF